MEMEPIQKNNELLDNSEVNSVLKKIYKNNTTVEKYFLEHGYALYKYGLYFGRCNEEDNVNCIGRGVSQVNAVVSDIVDQTPLRLLKEKKIIKLTSSTSNITKYLFYKTCGLINQECEGQDITKILNYEQTQEPKLYLLHFMFTHGPFYLDGLCGPYLSEIEMENFNKTGYRDALNCMNLEVKRLLDSIPSDSVVIIQSDHGPFEITRDRSNLNQMNKEDINSQYSIFSMSNIKSSVVLFTTQPFGVLLPHPLWSINVANQRLVSKNDFEVSEYPLPGPPCKKTKGIPCLDPIVS